MNVASAVQRSALVAQALILLVFAGVLVHRAFEPQCAGISSRQGGQGGLLCQTFLDRGGLFFLGAAIIAATVALIDLGAARRTYWPLALSVFALQIPLAIVEAMAIASWYQVGAAGWVLYGLSALVTTAMISVSSPVLPGLRALMKRSEGSPQLEGGAQSRRRR